MRKKLKRLALPIIAAVLALICVVCLLVYGHLAALLDCQHQAERWQGESEMEFSQLSCFMSVDEKLSMEQLYAFRKAMTDKFHEAALDIGSDAQLFCDAWCTFGKVNVSSDRGKGEVSAIAVGGNFFDFHPIRLLSGNYISPNDLMQDRVLLDEDTAWLLFGGTELSGMSFKINGVPFVVAGVIEREQDFASLKAYTSGMGVYMSYEAYKNLFDTSSTVSAAGTDSTKTQASDTVGINCYEVVMAEPVDGFAMNLAKEKFPIGGGIIVDNSKRFDYGTIIKLVTAFGERSMQTHGVILPYWENAARCIEDWCFALLVAAIITAILPAVLLIITAVRYFRRGKDKLEEDLLPRAKDSVAEAIRVRQRRAWEKRHLKKKE